MIQLSICIATYQRADVIGETLESVTSQLRDGVELVVVDGASPDATEAVVLAHFQGRADCRYVRLPRKGGVDQDYCLAVEHARGKYCWLMTDDDVLKPHAIDRVLESLRADPDLVVVNAEVAGPDLRSTLIPKKLKLAQDRAFPPGEDSQLLAQAGDLLTFIGAVVVRRAVWLERDPVPFWGSEFVHVGVIFQAPLLRGSVVIASPLVRIRYGRALWSARAFEIWMFKWPRLIWALPGMSDDARKAVCSREPWKRTTSLLLMKAQGNYTLDEYRRWLKPIEMRPLTRIRLATIAAFPDTLFNALMGAVLPVAMPQAQATIVDLRQSRFHFRRRWFG